MPAANLWAGDNISDAGGMGFQHLPPPQASLAAGEGVRGLSRNGKVAQHCPVFRFLPHSLDPLPVPGFLGTFQATISAHLCVLGSWFCLPPAHWESPLPMWGLSVFALHPPSTQCVESWLLSAFVQRLGQTPVLIRFYSSSQTIPILAGGIFRVVGFLVCSWWGAGFLRTESLRPGEAQGMGRGAGWESGASGLGAFRLPPQSSPTSPPPSQCSFPQKPECSLLHQFPSLGLCTRDPPAAPGLGEHRGIVTCVHSCSGLLASTVPIPGGLWHPHLDSSCVSSRRWLERVGTLFKIQCSGETLSTLGCSRMPGLSAFRWTSPTCLSNWKVFWEHQWGTHRSKEVPLGWTLLALASCGLPQWLNG